MVDTNNEIISKLKFISRIQKGQKINTKYLYIQPVGILTCISRALYYQDNRNNSLIFIQNTIARVFEIIDAYQYNNTISNKIMSYNLIEDLKNSKIGLTNLKETYLDDLKFGCDIDTLIQTIDAKIKQVDPEYLPIENLD